MFWVIVFISFAVMLLIGSMIAGTTRIIIFLVIAAGFSHIAWQLDIHYRVDSEKQLTKKIDFLVSVLFAQSFLAFPILFYAAFV